MRSSLELIRQIGRVFAGARSVVITGNVGDLHVGPEGPIVGFDHFLAHAGAAAGLSTARFSPATGTSMLTPPGRSAPRFAGPGPSSELAQALPRLLDALRHADDPMLLVVDWADGHFGRPGEPLGVLGELISTAATDPQLLSAGHRLAVIDRSGLVAPQLSALPGMHRLSIPLPNMEERQAFLAHFVSRHQSSRLADIHPGESVETVAAAANGMSLRSLLAVMGELGHDGAQMTATCLAPVKHGFLIAHTEGALRPLAGVRTVEEVAGVYNLKRLLADHRARPDLPLRNILLLGPPGTGKSTAAMMIGSALRLSVVALGDLRGPYVGESERRTRLMIDTVESMRPVVVFIDEIDQVFMRGDGPSGDSGVSNRLNAMLLEWTGAVGLDSGVLVVGATNHPERMDARERDRFVTVPVLLPDPREALDVMRIAAARMGMTIDDDGVAELVAERAGLLSGRMLSELVIVAAGSGRGPSERITADQMRAALADRLSWSDRREQELMTLQAVRHTGRNSLLPWVSARRSGIDYTVPPYLRSMLRSDGSIEMDALVSRIAELERRVL